MGKSFKYLSLVIAVLALITFFFMFALAITSINDGSNQLKSMTKEYGFQAINIRMIVYCFINAGLKILISGGLVVSCIANIIEYDTNRPLFNLHYTELAMLNLYIALISVLEIATIKRMPPLTLRMQLVGSLSSVIFIILNMIIIKNKYVALFFTIIGGLFMLLTTSIELVDKSGVTLIYVILELMYIILICVNLISTNIASIIDEKNGQ